MKVLIITHIFWPETADYKNLVLAQALLSKGHDVTVIAPFPNYPLGRLYDGYVMSLKQWELVEGVKVLRVPLYIDHSTSGFKRMLNYGTYTLSASSIGLLNIGKVDAVFVYAPPMTLGFTAFLYKKFFNARILLDVVDLWPDAIVGSGMVTKKIFINISGWIAKKAYQQADKITVLTEGYAKKVTSVGVPKDKIIVMPPWADAKVFISAEPDLDFLKKNQLEGKFCIIHAGNIGPFQDIENILHAAVLLRDKKEIRIVFVGAGRDFEKMKRKAFELKLENVTFTGSYPASRMPGIYAVAKGLLVSLRHDPYLSINLPSKIPGYLASSKPIICCADGESKRLIKDYGIGLACQPGDPLKLSETINNFMELNENERHEMGKRSRDIFDKLFDKDVLLKKYIDILEGMIFKY